MLTNFLLGKIAKIVAQNPSFMENQVFQFFPSPEQFLKVDQPIITLKLAISLLYNQFSLCTMYINLF